jgi:hypothetical protein
MTFIDSISSLSIGWICKCGFSATINPWENIAMHFCLTGQYRPQALKNIMENPTTDRYDVAKKIGRLNSASNASE